DLVNVDAQGLDVNEILRWDGQKWTPAGTVKVDQLVVTGSTTLQGGVKINQYFILGQDTINRITTDPFLSDSSNNSIPTTAAIKAYIAANRSQGPKGDTGVAGPTGPTGADGLQGPRGNDG